MTKVCTAPEAGLQTSGFVIAGILIIVLGFAAGIRRLAWEVEEAKESSKIPRILLAEVAREKAGSLTDSLFNLDTYLRLTYGENAVFSPVNTVDPEAFESSEQNTLKTLADPETGQFPYPLIDAGSERFRILVSTDQATESHAFPSELEAEFESL